jgi:hypothetical protein
VSVSGSGMWEYFDAGPDRRRKEEELLLLW